MISVIIPAHNEASVISKCITALLDQSAPGEIQVLIACNGCSDNTADIARGFGDRVEVIESPVASKSHALNLADQAARGFPRFYLDADVILPRESLLKIADVLQKGPALAAGPAVKFEVMDRPWTVRAFYDICSRLPFLHAGMVGTGVYALSEEGRKRFESFPNITADDTFVRLQFSPQERKTVDSCFSTVSVPRTLRSLIEIKTRSHFGNQELRRRYPEIWKNENTSHGGSIRGLFAYPQLWPGLAIYGYVRIMARVRARWKYSHARQNAWERDESSRAAVPSSPQSSPQSSPGTGSTR
jgi:glycosyltransferase involved in cell wall biosynthesis